MIKHVNGRNVSDYMNVKVRSHPVATIEHLINYVKPIARKKPKMLVIHSGANDLPNDMITVKRVIKVVKSIFEIDVNQEIQIAFSGIINREENNFTEKIEDRQLENYCKSKDFVFISNSNLDSSSFNRGRLSEKVLVYYAKTLLNMLRFFEYLMRRGLIKMIKMIGFR